VGVGGGWGGGGGGGGEAVGEGGGGGWGGVWAPPHPPPPTPDLQHPQHTGLSITIGAREVPSCSEVYRIAD